MAEYADILSIHRTAERCRAENIPLPEKALRKFVRDGSLPSIKSGAKVLLYFPNVKTFIEKGTPTEPQSPESGTIRRISE